MDIIIAVAIIVVALTVLYFFMTAGRKMAPEGAWLLQYRYAHRGLHNETYPENSIGAFENAVHNGYGIELDVHLSKDGEVVVFHDTMLGRVTGMGGAVEEMTLEQLKQAHLNGSAYTIPTLREVLHTVNGQVPILIEIKNEGAAGSLEEEVYKIVKAYSGLYALQSFSPFSIGWFYKNAPRILRGQLSTDFKEDAAHVAFIKRFFVRHLLTNFLCRPNFISYERHVIKTSVVQRLRRTGVPALAWVVRSEEEWQMADKYADAVIFENYEA